MKLENSIVSGTEMKLKDSIVPGTEMKLEKPNKVWHRNEVRTF